MPGRAALSTALAVAVLAAATAGCGPPPPQAPVGVASKVSSALTTIAAMCGESYRTQAFTAHPSLGAFDTTAASSARTLRSYEQRHPKWIYQGFTLAQLRTQAHSRLTECHLDGAARVLQG